MKSVHEGKQKRKKAANMVSLGLLKGNFTDSSNFTDTNWSLRLSSSQLQ